MAEENWPPDYSAEYSRRAKVLVLASSEPELAKANYTLRPIDFINDFCFTFDPRNAGSDVPATLPFVLFSRQQDLVHFFLDLLKHDISGLVEKSRDMGATWTAVCFSVWLWLFHPGASIGFGSRKEMLVDRTGDMDSIFEKIRFTLKNLPPFLLPEGFDKRQHSSYMKLVNPQNSSTITGEAGDNIGRGGRNTIYFKDESSHYQHAESIEAALLANTNVQVDMSSVHGTGTVFHRRRLAGEVWGAGDLDTDRTQVFIMDWRDHPMKTQEWYNRQKEQAEANGLGAIFAQEIERDYGASVLGTIIKADFVEAAIGLAEDFELEVFGIRRCGLDVADDGISGDKNALSFVQGLQLEGFEFWGQVDTGVTAQKAYSLAVEFGASEVHYDSIGVGAGVKAQFNQMLREKTLDPAFQVVPWVASGKVRDPHGFVSAESETSENAGPRNRDFFANFKAQAWWSIRSRFYNAWRCRQGLEFDRENVVSINRNIGADKIRLLVAELAQPTRRETTSGKMVVEKSPNGARSPNVADAVVMALYPAPKEKVSSATLII